MASYRVFAVAAVLVLLPTPSAAQSTRTDGATAFAIEAAGGIAGSAIGYGIVLAGTNECSRDEDLVSCVIGPLTAALALGTALSATGTVVAGRARRTRPSVPGAIVGALAGAVAGVGAEHLVREEMGVNTTRIGSMFILAVTQGLFTAATSRLFVALRREP